MKNWKIPREIIVENIIDAYRRGWYASIAQAAEEMTRFHYRGKSSSIARGRLRSDAIYRFYTEHGGHTKANQRIHAMASALRAEGWRLIDHEGRYLWRHDATGLMPSHNGGTFRTFAEATEFTFNSETRRITGG